MTQVQNLVKVTLRHMLDLWGSHPFQNNSNQLYLYSTQTQSHCLSELYNLQSERHLTLNSSGEKLAMLRKKKKKNFDV